MNQKLNLAKPEGNLYLEAKCETDTRAGLQGETITPEPLYLTRRKFIAGVGIVAAGTIVAACTRSTSTNQSSITPGFCNDAKALGAIDELGNKLTSCNDITTYNNFYEFSYGKGGIGNLSHDFKTDPWSVTVSGLVKWPGTYTVDELTQKYKPEERIYRMRCVEAWSMVIPWIGFPLARLLEDVQPSSEAKYVKFASFYDPKQMPGDKSLPFPYFEGLRIDESMHDLTILATGMYGKNLPPQDGAPIRLVVPWKYGFKSAKSIINIDVTSEKPSTFWSSLSSDEYGFYANVNPDVPHPRWSQASERRIGELARKPTLLFNGYQQVASLYEGMDLTKNF
jgi:methionine sulfoxide reductase catalytic subunit